MSTEENKGVVLRWREELWENEILASSMTSPPRTTWATSQAAPDQSAAPRRSNNFSPPTWPP